MSELRLIDIEETPENIKFSLSRECAPKFPKRISENIGRLYNQLEQKIK